MDYYTWILSFHVMAFISWMAALFYQPRLYVYHMEHFEKKEFVEVVKIQEYKLLKYIGIPAMWATLLSGGAMLYLTHPHMFEGGAWMHAKLTMVALLIVFTYALEFYRKRLENDTCVKSGKFFRVFNEVPTLISLAIVIFVVVKPF